MSSSTSDRSACDDVSGCWEWPMTGRPIVHSRLWRTETIVLNVFIHKSIRLTFAAASIRFEIWGVVEPGKKNRFSRNIFEKFWFFSGNFTKKKIDFSGQIFEKFWFFSGNFTNNKIDFSRQIFEEFWFFTQFQVISQKIPIFRGKFPKNFDF